MDKRQANETLLRRRPWASSQSDPSDREASQMAETDPALAKLQADQSRFNARVHDELAGIPVPDHLREQILARSKIIRVSAWKDPKRLLALAAAVLLTATGLFLWTRPTEDRTIAGFSSRMIGFALREYRMDIFTKDFKELQSFFVAKGRPTNFGLPRGLAQIPLKGGASLSWQGRPVSMVCFDWKGSETLYMFVMNDPLARETRIEPLKGLNTATWSADGRTFLLAGPIPEATLAELVRS